MRVVVNDRERQVRDGISIKGLLEELGVRSDAVAVELNRDVVPRNQHEQRLLSDGDRIEVVTFVGGG